MDKYYRVNKPTFLWKEGAILEKKKDSNGYYAVEDIWDVTPVNGGEYISTKIIEDPSNAEYFERVYPDTVNGKIYRTKDELIEAYNKAFK